jgi:Tfp pilus assembly protein PilF
MDDSTLNRFESMLESGMDNPLMRLSIGQAYLERGDCSGAIVHLRRALERDPNYTVAWKWLGKALEMAGEEAQAEEAYRKGLDVAQVKGDKQLERELTVFVKRLALRQ